MEVAQITQDHLYNKGDELSSRAGLSWSHIYVATRYPATDWTDARKVNFHLYDDDDILYYAGWLLNDDEGATQYALLRWAMSDSGATTIKVLIDGTWTQEIG